MPRADEPPLEIDAEPSRRRRLVGAAGVALVVLLVPLQALAQGSPWPLLALALLPLLPRDVEPRRLRLAGEALSVELEAGRRSGRLAGVAAISAVAVELRVRWEEGGTSRLVLWRDAVDDAAYRHLVRRLRRCPVEEGR